MNRLFWLGFFTGALVWIASLVGMYFRFPTAKIAFAILIVSNVLLVGGFFYTLMTGRAERVRRILRAYPALTGVIVSVLSMFYIIPCTLLLWLEM